VILSKPPGRSRLLLALGLTVALFSATFIAFDRSTSSAQQAPDTTVASTDTSDPASTDTTDTSAASDTTDTTVASTDTTEPSDTTDTTGADVTTTTAPAGNGDDGNINNLPLHDGTQKGGVFNPVPYGEIPANTPQVVIQRPGSGRILPLNQEIQIRAVVENFQPGFFNDPATQYGVDPQRLNDQGNLQGHNHACIQRIPSDGQVASKCDSFVVLEQEGTTNVISGVGPPITVAGRYRVCVDDASGAHYVAVRAFAQQGGPVDCVRVLFMRRTRR
jgi:hypothetical protein